MQMKIGTFAFVLLLAPSLALAEPIYLSCTVKSETTSKRFHIKLDEDADKITHTFEDGSAFNTQGFFSASAITYQNTNVSEGSKWTRKFKIDRTNLTVSETFIYGSTDPEISAKVPEKTTIWTGSCEIESVTDRKI